MRPPRGVVLQILIILGLIVLLHLGLWLIPTQLGDDLKTKFEITQSYVTILTIVIGGGWTFYIYIASGEYVARFDAKIDLKDLVEDTGGRIATIRVEIKNTGRVRVQKEICRVIAAPVKVISGLPTVVEEEKLSFPILNEDRAIEAGQLVQEDQPIPVDEEYCMYQIILRYWITSKRKMPERIAYINTQIKETANPSLGSLS